MKVLIVSAFLTAKEQPFFTARVIKAINAETRHAIRFGHNVTSLAQLRALVKEKPPEAIAFDGCNEDTMLIYLHDLAKVFPGRKFKFFSKDLHTIIPGVTTITSWGEMVGVNASMQESSVLELQSA